MKTYKTPISVLVVIYTTDGEVLLIERADAPGYWQSVTGSQDPGETLEQTAVREVMEETGIDATQYTLTDWGYQNIYEIYPQWRYKYAPGTVHNTEHVFGLELSHIVPVRLAEREHVGFEWLPIEVAAQKCFSPSNAEAVRRLLHRRA